MKKSVMALAAVAATVLGISALGLAACDDEESPFGNEHTITFDANGGAFAEGTTTPVTRKTIAGKLIAFPDDPTVAPSGTDYTFKGWSLRSNGTADDAVSLPMTFSSDKTLYAIWGGETTDTGAYEITFNPNGGTITSGSSTMTTVNGRLASLPTAEYGTHAFLGWYKVKNSTVAADKVTTATLFDAPIEVYASWGEESQTPVTEKWVTFNANGGTYNIDGEVDTITSLETTNGVISELPVPVRDGWKFLGYYKDYLSDAEPFTETTTVDDNMTVYAHWQELGSQEQEDGMYVGGKLVKALTPNGAGEVKVEHVTLKTNDVIVFVYNSDPVDVTMKPDGDTPNSKKIAKVGGELTVVEGGTFTFYLTISGGALWVTDEADPEESELQAGDGIYAGATLLKAFEINAGGLNEIMATGVVVDEAATLEIKYGGKIVTDWTLKADSDVPQTALVGGKLSLEAATYNFYYNYGTKVMYVGIESGEDPVGEHTGAYVINGVETALTNNDSIADTADIELYATGVSLTAGQVLSFKADGKPVSTPLHGNNCHGASVNVAAGTVTITKTDIFDIYLRHYDADDNGNAACWTIEVNNGDVYEALADTYYIVGGMNSWDLAEGCNLTASDGKYTLTTELTNQVEFKVVLTDADGKLDWDTQKNYTLSSKVAKKLTDGNFQITGGDGSYTITLSGTTVTVTKEGEDPDPDDPTYEKDGLYVDGTLVMEFAEHEGSEVKLMGVNVPEKSTITFVYNHVEVTPVIKDNCPEKGRFVEWYCKDGGKFDMYYDFGSNQIWIEYNGAYVPPLTVDVVKVNGTEMTDNTANINTGANPTQTMEYKATLTLASGDTISFDVDGTAIEVWVERKTNVAITGVGSRTTSFKTKLEGEFSFTLKYHTDGGADKNGGWTVYVDGPVEEVGEEPALVKGNFYLLGGETGFEKVSGYRQLDANGSITLEITEGQQFKFAKCGNATTGAPDWSVNYGYGAVTTGSGYVSSNSDGNMVFKKSGTYTITLSGTSVTITSDDVEEPVVQGPKVVAIGSSGVWLVGEGLAGGGWTNGIELNAANGYSVTVEVTTAWLKIRNGGTSDGSGTTALANTTYAQVSGNNIVMKSAGTYTFTWDTTTKKLTITQA